MTNSNPPKPFSVLFPSLTEGEINMLVRLLEDEVIGSDDIAYQRYLIASTTLNLEFNQTQARLLKTAVNMTRAAQRERLQRLVRGDKS